MVLPHPEFLERLVELDYEIVAETLPVIHETVVVAPAADLTFGRVDMYFAHVGITVEHQPCITPVGRIRETQMHPALRRRHFGADTVVELNTVIIRFAHLIVVAELGGTRILVNLQLANHRHERIHGIVAHPRTALVSLGKTADGIRSVGIFETVAVLTRLRRPEM